MLKISSLLILYLLSIAIHTYESSDIPDPLNQAVYIADVEATKVLIKRHKENVVKMGEIPVVVDRVDKHGRTQLLNCGFDPQTNNIDELDDNCLQIVKILIHAGANVTHIDKYGDDALSLSVTKGMSKYSSYLIKTGGLNVNRKDNKGVTPLMKVCGLGLNSMFHALLLHNANITEADSQGLSSLHYATRLAVNDATQVSFLSAVVAAYIASDISVDSVRDIHGRTPLMYAIIGKSSRCTRLLLDHGADARLYDNFNITCTSMSKIPAIQSMLREATVAAAENDHKIYNNRNNKSKSKCRDANSVEL